MNTKLQNISELRNNIPIKKRTLKQGFPGLVFIALLALWFLVPGWLRHLDQRSGSIDQSIWLLIILSMICFLMIVGISWWLLSRFWRLLKLPSLKFMVSQFNTLTLWQQLSFYWGSFALFLLAALGCLSVIC
jgi:hypothetical protein